MPRTLYAVAALTVGACAPNFMDPAERSTNEWIMFDAATPTPIFGVTTPDDVAMAFATDQSNGRVAMIGCTPNDPWSEPFVLFFDEEPPKLQGTRVPISSELRFEEVAYPVSVGIAPSRYFEDPLDSDGLGMIGKEAADILGAWRHIEAQQLRMNLSRIGDVSLPINGAAVAIDAVLYRCG